MPRLHAIARTTVLAAALAVLPAAVGPAGAQDDPPIIVSHASGGADVSDEAQTTVVLHAGVVANGHTLSCEVDYARDNVDDPDGGPYTGSVPCREAVQPDAPGEQPVSAALSGLQPGSHYRFQFLIKDADDATLTRHTNESTFDTLAVAPGVVTGDATPAGDFAVTLRGTIDPHGDPTTCRFDFGPTTAYDDEVSCAERPGSGEGPVAVSAGLGDLTPGATYHYRLVGAKRDQEIAGADRTFTVPMPSRGGATTPGGGGGSNNNNNSGGSGSARPGGGGSSARGRLSVPASARARGGRVRLALRCAAGPCRGTLVLKARLSSRGRVRTIGHAAVALAAGAHTTVTVRLTAAAAGALRHHHALTVAASGVGVHRTLRVR